VLERADVSVSIGSPRRRSEEWQFCCYNQLMLRLWTRSLWRTVDGTLTHSSSALCLQIQVSSPSREWVSRIFHRVTTHRPGFFAPCRSTWCSSVFPHNHFHGNDALCFIDWAFSLHRRHITSAGKCWFDWMANGLRLIIFPLLSICCARLKSLWVTGKRYSWILLCNTVVDMVC